MVPASLEDELLLLPLRQVLCGDRAWAAGADVTVEVVSPPYPCAGTGELRVIRFLLEAGAYALTAAYEGYDRLAGSR
jgi:hypothetical protein